MGTRGYRVYRYKGYYLIIYNHFDSYPDSLGVEMLYEVEASPEKYEKWLSANRAKLLQRFENWEKAGRPDDSHRTTISRVEPANDLFIEWMYELDFDHEVFLVDGEPLFSMRSMPPEDVFLESIHVDSFGHRACHKHTPEQYRYNWKVAPPTVDPTILNKYKGLPGNSSCPLKMDDSMMLAGEFVSHSATQVRIHLYDAFVRVLLHDKALSHYLRRVDLIETWEDIPLDLAGAGILVLQLAIHPMIFEKINFHGTASFYCHRTIEDAEIAKGYVWLVENVLCVRMATHLDDESCLQAAVVDLLEHIQARIEQSDSRVVYGILFSFTHCVILEANYRSSSFVHSPALRFLPSFYWVPSDPIPPGIIAIANLGFILHPHLILNDKQLLPSHPSTTIHISDNSVVHTIPAELWSNVAWYLYTSSDLAALSCISETARSAVIDILHYPLLCGARLVKPFISDCDSGTTSPNRPILQKHCTGAFNAVYDVRPAEKPATASKQQGQPRKEREIRPREVLGRSSNGQNPEDVSTGLGGPEGGKVVGILYSRVKRAICLLQRPSAELLEKVKEKPGIREHLTFSLEDIHYSVEFGE